MKSIIIVILFFLSISVYSESESSKDSASAINDSSINTSSQVRNVIWFTPSRTTTINGWSLGWMLAETTMMNGPSQINGLHTGVS